MNALAKLGMDIVNGTVDTKFASEDGSTNMEVLYQGLVEINGGSKVDYRKLQNGRSNGLFEIIETILSTRWLTAYLKMIFSKDTLITETLQKATKMIFMFQITLF